VWISQNSTISDSNFIALEALLQTKSEKDLSDMRSEGVEPIYWGSTESGLIEIYNFPGVIYATDGSKGSTGMGARFYRHDTKGGGCCRVGGGVGGGSSSRAEFAAACLAFEDSLTHDQSPIVVLTDSQGIMTVASNWVGEGKDPLLLDISLTEIYSPVSSRFYTRGLVWASSPCLLKSEPIGASFSTKRQTDGPMRVERISTMYDGTGLAYNLLSRGLRKESNTGAP